MAAHTTKQRKKSTDPGHSDTTEIPPSIEKSQLEPIY